MRFPEYVPGERLLYCALPFIFSSGNDGQRCGVLFTLYGSYLPLPKFVQPEIASMINIEVLEEFEHVQGSVNGYVTFLRYLEGRFNVSFLEDLTILSDELKDGMIDSSEILRWVNALASKERLFNMYCGSVKTILEPHFVSLIEYLVYAERAPKLGYEKEMKLYAALSMKEFTPEQTRLFDVFSEGWPTLGIARMLRLPGDLLEHLRTMAKEDLETLETKLRVHQRLGPQYKTKILAKIQHPKILRFRLCLLRLLARLFPPNSVGRLRAYRLLVGIGFRDFLDSYTAVLVSRPAIDRMLFRHADKLPSEYFFRQMGVLNVNLADDGRLRVLPVEDLNEKELELWRDHLFGATLRWQMESCVAMQEPIECIGENIDGLCNRRCARCHRDRYVKRARYLALLMKSGQTTYQTAV